MTPREKAEELFDEFQDAMPSASWYEQAKLCALIAVNEICDVLWEQLEDRDRIIYWEDVKQEIEKL